MDAFTFNNGHIITQIQQYTLIPQDDNWSWTRWRCTHNIQTAIDSSPQLKSPRRARKTNQPSRNPNYIDFAHYITFRSAFDA